MIAGLTATDRHLGLGQDLGLGLGLGVALALDHGP